MTDDPELEPTLERVREVARFDPRGAAFLATHLDRTWAGAVFLFSGRRRHELSKVIAAAELSEQERADADLYASVRATLEGSALATVAASPLMAPASAAPSNADGSRTSAAMVFGSLLILGVALVVAPRFGFFLFFLPIFALRRMFRHDPQPDESPENLAIAGPGFDERRALIEGDKGRRIAVLVEAHPALAYDAFPRSESPFR